MFLFQFCVISTLAVVVYIHIYFIRVEHSFFDKYVVMVLQLHILNIFARFFVALLMLFLFYFCGFNSFMMGTVII